MVNNSTDLLTENEWSSRQLKPSITLLLISVAVLIHGIISFKLMREPFSGHVYDEMAGMIPFFQIVASAILVVAVGGYVLYQHFYAS